MVIFSVLLALCAGNSSVTGELCLQRPVTLSFHVFFDLRRNGWVNNRDTVDLRRYHAHYDVTVMYLKNYMFFEISVIIQIYLSLIKWSIIELQIYANGLDTSVIRIFTSSKYFHHQQCHVILSVIWIPSIVYWVRYITCWDWNTSYEIRYTPKYDEGYLYCDLIDLKLFVIDL